MKKWRSVVIMVAMIALYGCGSAVEEGQEDAQKQAEEWAESHGGETLEIHLEGAAVIGCPIGVVCDENFDYRAFRFVDQGVRLRLSFDAVIAEEITLALLEEHFNVASLNYSPPELQTDRWSYHFGGDVALRADDAAVEFTAWEDGRAQGEIRTTLSGLRGQLRDVEGANPECFMMGGSLPEECTIRIDVERPLVLSFDLALPTGTQDCDSGRAEGCGN